MTEIAYINYGMGNKNCFIFDFDLMSRVPINDRFRRKKIES